MATNRYTPEQKAEVRKMLAENLGKDKEIADALGVSYSFVAYQKQRLGMTKGSKTKGPNSVTALEKKINIILARRKEEEKELADLRALRDSLNVDIQTVGNYIIVSGIGDVPFKAPALKWFNFLKNGGGVKVREAAIHAMGEAEE